MRLPERGVKIDDLFFFRGRHDRSGVFKKMRKALYDSGKTFGRRSAQPSDSP
jgi:hypothetical protein